MTVGQRIYSISVCRIKEPRKCQKVSKVPQVYESKMQRGEKRRVLTAGGEPGSKSLLELFFLSMYMCVHVCVHVCVQVHMHAHASGSQRTTLGAIL